MLYRFERLKHVFTMQIKRCKPGFIHAKQVLQCKTSICYAY